MRTVKEMVRDRRIVSLKYYKDGILWYSTECGFIFPVPIKEVEGTKVYSEDKAMVFMKYIKRQHDLLGSIGA